jgi:hypothetical protein
MGKKVKLFSCLVPAFIIAGILVISSGCNKNVNSVNTTVEIQIVPRDPAYPGSYPIVGTRQIGFWDGTGNSIAAPAPDAAFYGQDAQFTHTAPAYTKSSDGLTVKDEVTGLTWQKSHDTGTY